MRTPQHTCPGLVSPQVSPAWPWGMGLFSLGEVFHAGVGDGSSLLFPSLRGDPGVVLEFSVLIPGCVCVSPGLLPAWAELHSPGPGRVPSVAGAVAQALLSAPRYLWEGEHTQKPSLGTPGEFWVMGGTLSPSGLTPHTCAQVSLSCRALVSDCSPEERKTGVGWECGTRSPVLPPVHPNVPNLPISCLSAAENPPCPPQASPATQGSPQCPHSASPSLPSVHPVPTPVSPSVTPSSPSLPSASPSVPRCLSQSPQCPPVPVPVSYPAPMLLQPPKPLCWPTAWSCCPSTTASPQSDSPVSLSPAWSPDGSWSGSCVSLPSASCPDPVIPSLVLPKFRPLAELVLAVPFLWSPQSARCEERWLHCSSN